MPGAHNADRSARPRLPRKAKLPKTPPRPRHQRLTRATAAPVVVASYLSSPVSPDPLTDPDDNSNSDSDNNSNSDSDNVSGPQHRMLGTRKRKAGPKHGRSTATKRPRRSPRTSNANISYAESDTNSDADTDLDAIDDARYNDISHQDLNDSDDDARGRTSHYNRLSQTRKLVKSSPTSRIATARDKKPREKSDEGNDWGFPAGEIPFLVWTLIFDYIASPLQDPEARLEDVAAATRKLLKVAFLGRVVYEPAMIALYRCPPILDRVAFCQLSRTLQCPPTTTIINYRPKVEALRIDVGNTLHFKYNGGHLLLDDLVPYLPRLMDLELYHDLDKAPYRSLEDTIRFKYPENLLQVLGPMPDADADEKKGNKTRPTELQSWRWNARFTGHGFPLEKLTAIHSNQSFTSLRKIAFMNYQSETLMSTYPTPEMEERDQRATEALAAALLVLPRLEHLVLESSTMANPTLLEKLPRTLKHFELINCWEVTAEDLTAFLITHGHSLERLTLNHCIALSLGFLRVLEQACPNLTHLHMNLLYYRAHEHYHDSEPLWTLLLKEGEVPKWPSSIQSIEIRYMQFGDVKLAEMLFKSLIDSAPKLPNLRRLLLGVKLNVSVRERAEFRKTWEERTTRVFQRRASSPVSHIRGAKKSGHHSLKSENPRGRQLVKAPTRRSTRRLNNPLPPTPDSSTVRENSTRASALAKQLQWSMRDIPASRHHDADEEDNGDETGPGLQGPTQLEDEQGEGESVDFIHGLCDMVEIEVDNQKPTELKFSMDDFVDSPSADESDAEWNGDESEEDFVIE